MHAALDYSAPRNDADLIDDALADAVQSFGALRRVAVSLGGIDLPDLPDGPLGAAENAEALKVAASLYLVMELEATGLMRACSALAALFVSGALRLSPGPGADMLADYHRNYENRLSSDDRQAAYLQLFGEALPGSAPFAMENAINDAFEENLLTVCEAMHQYANASLLTVSPASSVMKIKQAARRLGANLVHRIGGAAAYIAEEALHVLTDVVAILKSRDIQRSLRARTIWETADAALALSDGAPWAPNPQIAIDARARLARGKSGMTILRWVADEASSLESVRGFDLRQDDPVLANGTAWLKATLDLLSQAEA